MTTQPETTPTLEVLAEYVGGEATSAYLADCLTEAAALVSGWIAANSNPDTAVPAAVQRRATLEVAAELWYRRQARGGIATFDGTDMAPVRLARDPLKAAHPILAPYLLGSIG